MLCGAVSGDKSNLERLENNYLKYNNVDPLISFMLGFHAEYTCEKELMEGVASLRQNTKRLLQCTTRKLQKKSESA